MAPKATRDQVRQDLVRLLRGVDLYRDWRIAMWQRAHGPDAQYDPNEFVETGATTLAAFDSYTGPQYRQFLTDVQTWYAVTAGELVWLQTNGDAEVKTRVDTFLKKVETHCGFAFFAQAGLLDKTARKVLKRGRIANTEEWAILSEVLNDTDQQAVSGEDRARIETLTAEYEAAQ